MDIQSSVVETSYGKLQGTRRDWDRLAQWWFGLPATVRLVARWALRLHDEERVELEWEVWSQEDEGRTRPPRGLDDAGSQLDGVYRDWQEQGSRWTTDAQDLDHLIRRAADCGLKLSAMPSTVKP